MVISLKSVTHVVAFIEDTVVLKLDTISHFSMRVQRYFENWFWAMQIVINYGSCYFKLHMIDSDNGKTRISRIYTN